MSNELMAMLGLQIVGAVALVTTIKADLRWIKRMLVDHETRLRKLEQGRRGAVEYQDMTELGV